MRTTQASLRMPNPLGAHDAGAAATRPGELRRAAEMRYPPRRWEAFAVAASRGRDANLCSDREHHRTGGLFLVRSGGLHCLLRCRRRPAVVRARPYMSAETPASPAAQARSIRPSSARQGRNAEGVREPAPRRASAAKPSALHRRRHSPPGRLEASRSAAQRARRPGLRGKNLAVPASSSGSTSTWQHRGALQSVCREDAGGSNWQFVDASMRCRVSQIIQLIKNRHFRKNRAHTRAKRRDRRADSCGSCDGKVSREEARRRGGLLDSPAPGRAAAACGGDGASWRLQGGQCLRYRPGGRYFKYRPPWGA